MTKKEFKIEDLPGVGAATAEKLREAGYDNLMSIAVSSPGEMIEVAGVTEGTAKRIINVARSKLDMGFESGEDLLKKREQIIKITTGSKGFDAMLQGGFESGSISECYGEFGCVAHDTMITLADGQMKQIGDIANGFEAGEYELNLPITTWFNNSLSKTFARKLFVYNCDKLLKITLEDGREIKVTPNHPLMTQNGWKRADQLNEYENLIVSWPNNFPNQEVKLSREIKLNEKAPKSIIKKVSLPKTLNSKLASLLGYYLAEGWSEHRGKSTSILRISIGSSNKEIINHWKELVRDLFEIDSALKKIEKRTESWSINSVIVGGFLKQFEGIYRTAHFKEVPRQIFESPKEVVSSFLASLYDGEGFIKFEKGKQMKLAKWKNKDGTINKKMYLSNKKGKSIEFRNSSIRMIQQVQLLLSKFSIKSSITKDKSNGFVCYKLHIYRKENLIRFYDAIGVKTVRLKNKLEDTIKAYQRELQIQNINILKIKSVEQIVNAQGKVYDIEVPQTHSFLANNIVSHNSSKSQIAHVLAVRTQLPKEQGGADGSVIFLDGESTFRPERIQQISSALNLDSLEVLKNIKVARAFNSDHQMLLAEKAEEIVKEGINGKPVRLIVVDSLTSHFRADFTGRGMLADRQQKLNKHMHTLMKLANQYNLCVYVTNQVMAKPDTFFGDPTAAIGGNIVGHNCLVPWTLIQLNDGSIKPIGEIYNYNKICSIDMNTFKSKTEKTGTVVFKQNKEDLYRIRTNREIDTSGTHRFFKIENFKIVEVMANELVEGDYIAQGFDFDIDGEEQKLPNFEIERLVNISEKESNKLKKFLKEKGITRKDLCKSLEITPRQLRRVLNQGYPTNMGNFEIFKENGIPVCMNLVQTYKHREIVMPNSFNSEFAQVMGYFLGDGNLEDRSIRFRDARIDVLQYYQKSLENIFGLKIRRISKVKDKECFSLELNGTVVRDLFEEVENNLFDYVCKSPKQHICRFIKGFFDAEGSVDKKVPRISASQKDGQVLQHIQLLLDRLGIRSRIRNYIVKGNKIHQLDIVDNKSVLKYIELIGMTAGDKSILLNKWRGYCEKSFTQEMTPIKRKDLWNLLKNSGLYPTKFIRSRENPRGGYEYLGERELKNAVKLLMHKDLDVEVKEAVEFLNTLFFSEMKFEMVKKISRVKYDGVLVDFEVPMTNNYIANGFVVHNSQTRIYLRKGKKGSRVAKLVDSPHIADSECCYMVTEKGLVDLE